MAENKPDIAKRPARGARRRNIIVVAAVVVVLAGLGAWRVTSNKSKTGGYLTRPVAYGDIATTVGANATVQPTQETVLSFKNSGYVQDVYVTEGQFVKAGTVLAKEQASDYQAQLNEAEANLLKVPDEISQAKAALAQAQNNLDLAKTTLDQDKTLFASGAISRSNLDSAQNSYQNDLIQVQSAQSSLNMAVKTDALTAQAQVTMAKNNLAGCEIVSTMDGYVVNINGSAGQWTQGGAPSSSSSTTSSQFAITISSNKLELLAEINQADIAKVSTGDKVTFTVDAYPGKTFTGRITTLAAEAAAVQGVQYYASFVAIDDQTGLKAGMPAAMNIIAAEKSHVLVVPRTALDYASSLVKGARTGSSFVAVLAAGRPRLVPVKTGLMNNSMAEITSGLSAGQEVILSGQTRSASGGSTSQGQNNRGGPSTTRRAMHMMGG